MSNLDALTPGQWNIDAAHSTVGFVARHLMISKVKGRFTGVTGSVTVAEDRLASTVSADVDAASISTGDEGRDGHLKSPDFFDVENHPTWTFRSTSIQPDGDEYTLNGDITIHGVTKPISFELEFEGVSVDPWGNTKAGFSAESSISRKEFGLEWNAILEAGGVAVGDKVNIELDIQLIRG